MSREMSFRTFANTYPYKRKIKMIIEYRTFMKLLQGFITSLIAFIDHILFIQAVTVAGHPRPHRPKLH